VAFETLQTEYWVASRDAIAAELKKRNLAMLEAIADGDANRQLLPPKTPDCGAYDSGGQPRRHSHRALPSSSAKNDERSVTVVADNFTISSR
jgi:hypothetical protein